MENSAFINQKVPKRTPKPRERNSILKKYYGIKDTTIAVATVQAEQNSNPFDIDGNTFNSSQYFALQLKEKSLQGLIEKDNELVGEIREIDGEMKTLVYENYNKFISATDTIRKMKSNVESMESEMSRLNESINSISTQSLFINQQLGPNRQKIQQLSNVHNSLKRLQFIFELPNRLQQCLNKKKYRQAVTYYSKASRLLNHYKHMAAFKGIECDCAAIMEKIKAGVWSSMTDPNVTLAKIAQETKLLVLLGEDSHKLWKQYIDIQISMLKKKQEQNLQPDTIQDLILFYVTPLEDIVRHFESLFLLGYMGENDNDGTLTSQLNIEDKEEARLGLLEAINPYLDKFFEMAAKFIELPDNISSDFSPLKQSEYLSELKSALHNQTQSLVSVAKIDGRMVALIAKWENDLINGLLDSTVVELSERFNRFVSSLKQENKSTTTGFDTDTIAGFIQDTQAWIIEHLINVCLLPLRSYLDIKNKSTLERIQVGIKSSWEKLANKFENIHNSFTLEPSSLQILMLVASRLCYDLADNAIFQVYSYFSSMYLQQQRQQQQHEYYRSSSTNINPRVIPDMNNMVEIYLKAGQALLNMQMMQEGYRLSTIIQEAYFLQSSTTEEHHSGSNVTRVSDIWFLIHNKIKYAERLVEAVYPQQQQQHQQSSQRGSIDGSSDYDYSTGTNTTGVPPPPFYSNGRSLQSTQSLVSSSSEAQTMPPSATRFGSDLNFNMMNNIDKLFAERVDVYNKDVEPTPVGICNGLIMIMLKAFLEVTREIHMDTIACKQIQLDIEYIKRFIWPFTGDEMWTTNILQEVLSSAYTRCAFPTAISQDELASILSP